MERASGCCSAVCARADLVTEVPADRWDWRKYYGDPAKEKNKTNSRWGAFIDDVDSFDAEFFKLSALEAEVMDPQHRLFLQTVWNTIEDAGYRRLGEAGGRDEGPQPEVRALALTLGYR